MIIHVCDCEFYYSWLSFVPHYILEASFLVAAPIVLVAILMRILYEANKKTMFEHLKLEEKYREMQEKAKKDIKDMENIEKDIKS